MAAQKIVFRFIISLLLLFTFVSPAFAQSASPSSNLQLPTSISPTSPVYTDLLVHNMFHTFSCLAVGSSVIGQPCLTYQMTKNAQGAIQGIPVLSQVNLSGGTLGAVTGVIGALYQYPPVRTADYLASLGEGLGIVKEANAQVGGSGAKVLSPIISLWQVSRNISYLIMIIIFVIIGIMVMFRQRINPQTVITAQAAIPGLVIGLILITFSYFLAGLISDTAFIGTNLVGYYFSAAQSKPPQNLVENISSKNVLSIIAPLTKIVDSGKVAGALGSIWNDLATPNTGRWNPLDLDPQKVLTYLAMFITTQFVLPFGGLVPGIGQVIAAGAALTLTGIAPVQVASLAISFIAMLALIYAMFRLLLRLINNFITIIFLTITAPFQFLFASLPGRQGIATDWILNMLGNILAFPAVLAVLYFIAFILGPDLRSNCTDPCPFIISSTDHIKITDTNTFPLFGGFDLNFINLLLAFGALLALPAIPDIVIRTVGKASQAGQLIGQEIGAGTGAGQRYAGQFQSGTQGLAGQLGNLRDQPGYVLTDSGWRKVLPSDTAAERTASGARPGLGTRIKATVGSWIPRRGP